MAPRTSQLRARVHHDASRGSCGGHLCAAGLPRHRHLFNPREGLLPDCERRWQALVRMEVPDACIQTKVPHARRLLEKPAGRITHHRILPCVRCASTHSTVRPCQSNRRRRHPSGSPMCCSLSRPWGRLCAHRPVLCHAVQPPRKTRADPVDLSGKLACSMRPRSSGRFSCRFRARCPGALPRRFHDVPSKFLMRINPASMCYGLLSRTYQQRKFEAINDHPKSSVSKAS